VADLTEAIASQLPSVGNSQSAAQRFLEEVDAALILEALSLVKGVKKTPQLSVGEKSGSLTS